MEKGLTPIRTARTISGVIALVGMLVLLIQRVLSGVLVMAHEMLSLAFARYGNFTGRFAANNFAEDKKLLSLLQAADHIGHDFETRDPVIGVQDLHQGIGIGNGGRFITNSQLRELEQVVEP